MTPAPRSIAAALLCGLWLPPALALPDGAAPPGVRGAAGGLATRSVSEHLRLERALQQALDERDRAAAEALLDDAFEARSAASPDGLGRGDWLAQALAAPVRGSQPRDLAVREVDDLALVSFVLDAPHRSGRPPVFVVDLWRRSTGRLLSRFTSRPGPSPAPARPSGRE